MEESRQIYESMLPCLHYSSLNSLIGSLDPPHAYLLRPISPQELVIHRDKASMFGGYRNAAQVRVYTNEDACSIGSRYVLYDRIRIKQPTLPDYPLTQEYRIIFRAGRSKRFLVFDIWKKTNLKNSQVFSRAHVVPLNSSQHHRYSNRHRFMKDKLGHGVLHILPDSDDLSSIPLSAVTVYDGKHLTYVKFFEFSDEINRRVNIDQKTVLFYPGETEKSIGERVHLTVQQLHRSLTQSLESTCTGMSVFPEFFLSGSFDSSSEALVEETEMISNGLKEAYEYNDEMMVCLNVQKNKRDIFKVGRDTPSLEHFAKISHKKANTSLIRVLDRLSVLLRGEIFALCTVWTQIRGKPYYIQIEMTLLGSRFRKTFPFSNLPERKFPNGLYIRAGSSVVVKFCVSSQTLFLYPVKREDVEESKKKVDQKEEDVGEEEEDVGEEEEEEEEKKKKKKKIGKFWFFLRRPDLVHEDNNEWWSVDVSEFAFEGVIVENFKMILRLWFEKDLIGKREKHATKIFHSFSDIKAYDVRPKSEERIMILHHNLQQMTHPGRKEYFLVKNFYQENFVHNVEGGENVRGKSNLFGGLSIKFPLCLGEGRIRLNDMYFRPEVAETEEYESVLKKGGLVYFDADKYTVGGRAMFDMRISVVMGEEIREVYCRLGFTCIPLIKFFEKLEEMRRRVLDE